MQDQKIHLPRARPPATVRLQGLVTLLTAFALLVRAGSVSHRQRSGDSPFEAFSSRTATAAFPPRPDPLAVSPVGIPSARGSGPAQQAAASGSLPPESPSRPDGGLVRQPPDAPLGFRCTELNPEHSGEELAGLCVHLASRRTLRPTRRCSLASLYALPQSLRISLRCQAFATSSSQGNYTTKTADNQTKSGVFRLSTGCPPTVNRGPRTLSHAPQAVSAGAPS